MSWMQRSTVAFLTASVLGLGLWATTALAGPGDSGPGQKQEKRVVMETIVGPGGPMGMDLDHFEGADRLKITDLDTMALGESRYYQTDKGQQVYVTREEDERWKLELGDHEVMVGGGAMNLHMNGTHDIHGHEAHGENGERVHKVEKRIVVRTDGDGEEDIQVWHSEDGTVHELGEGKHAVFVRDEGLDGEAMERTVVIDGDDGARREIKVRVDSEGGEPMVWVTEDGEEVEGAQVKVIRMDREHSEITGDGEVEKEIRILRGTGVGGGVEGDATVIEIERSPEGADGEVRLEKQVIVLMDRDEDR